MLLSTAGDSQMQGLSTGSVLLVITTMAGVDTRFASIFRIRVSVQGATSMLKVEIHKLSENSGYEKLGEVIWDGKQLRVKPKDNPDLKQLAAEPYWLSTSDEVEEFDPKNDPEAWILSLHKRYPSPSIIVEQAISSRD